MQVKNELRKQHKTITADFKSRAQKAEKILGEIENHEAIIETLTAELSTVLALGAVPVAAKAPKAKVAKTAKAKRVSKRKNGRPSSQKNSVRDFLIQAGHPMKIAEIVRAMQKAGHVFTAKNALRATDRLLYKNKKVFKKVSPDTFTAG